MRKKSNKLLIIKCSNNPIVDVLRPAQKLQVWNTYIPGDCRLLTYRYSHSCGLENSAGPTTISPDRHHMGGNDKKKNNY